MRTRKITVAIIMIILVAVMIPVTDNYAQQMSGMRRHGGMWGRGMMGHGGMMGGYGMMNGGMMGNMMGYGMMNWGTLGNPGFYLEYADELDLSAQQIENLKTTRMNLIKDTADNRSELQIVNQELQDTLEMERINIGTVEEKINRIHELQAENQLIAVEAGIKARNTLTPAQRKQAIQLENQWYDTYGNTYDQQQRRPGRGGHSGMMR